MFRQRLSQLRNCLSDRVARRVGLSTGVTFVLLYLYSVGNILIAPGTDLAFGSPVPSASILSDWPSKMWQPTAPFVWEPVAAVYLNRSVTLFISVPNSLLALLLGTLVGLNMAVAIGRARMMAGQSGGGYMSGFFASLPALLTDLPAVCRP